MDALTDYGDGLSFYRRIKDIKTEILNSKGTIIMEFGKENQIDYITHIFSKCEHHIHNDINDKPRFIEINI